MKYIQDKIYSGFSYLKNKLYISFIKQIMIMIDYRYIKFESQKKRSDDCVIRAIMKLTGKPWLFIYDELCEIGRLRMRMPNEMKVVEVWLSNNGYIKKSFGKLKKGEHRISVHEFATTHNKGKYLLNLRGHVVACIDGFYYDSWDSGYCKVLCYYEKLNNN